ncbi:Cytochrome P450 [Glarea lozoyensis ATCC 20868]|uniref:Cytochrome P450 n=1 Tax=Glarea lozoyensis (strain ATCC 20868 / MF5171) TaxID=1116229 RepID=S3DFD5_GLAL2|nr:Cytochrome P450 [Glarea lozoyensis ATCC 20868]EPE36480.1 Cytochrome P450 [Glarea lozoyensis ATCC 20868]
MNEEIRDGLRRVIWEPSAKTGGKLDEWSATEILHTTQSVISQLICRLVVGRTFSRNLEFTQKVADFSYSVIIWSIILDWIPDFLRPWIAWLLPIEKTKSKISDYLCGEILRCLSSPLASTETSAILHQLVHLSRAENGNSFYSVDETIKCVTTQFLSITFGAIDPTTVAVSQVVLDLLSQPSSKYLVALQEEATTVLARHGGNWSLEAVKELKLMDSFIRESQRLHPIGITLAARKVIHKGGWTFENGDHAPAGSLISVPTYAIHHDKALYSDPEQFEGFRFVEDDKLKTTGDAFLAFGYGRHAW